MIRHASITIGKLTAAVRRDDGTGYCNACGAKHPSFVEPDAEHYRCTRKKCGATEVYGAEQLLLLTEA